MEVSPSSVSPQDITWESSDQTVAEVRDTGDPTTTVTAQDAAADSNATISVSFSTSTGKVYTEQATIEVTGEADLGDVGPAGGHIFYVDRQAIEDDIDKDWYYLEAAPVGTEWDKKSWGGKGTDTNASDESIGAGYENTDLINSELSGSDYAAALAWELEHTDGEVTFNDWFLPSKDALDEIYEQLYDNSTGGFTNDCYWSSTEDDSDNAWQKDFKKDEQKSSAKSSSSCKVRAIRRF